MIRLALSLLPAGVRSLLLAAALAGAGVGLTPTPAHATGYATCGYRWVACYETRQMPYTVCETRYDSCGRCYQVYVTRYRVERVRVWRQVTVY